MRIQKDATQKMTEDLLYQALETEIGGVEIYKMAILCARNEDLKEEWTKYLSETERHVEVVRGIFDALSLDPEATTPGRMIVRATRESSSLGDADGPAVRADGCRDRGRRVRRRRRDEGPRQLGADRRARRGARPAR
jgi:hypothetical protein